ncbi:hypothetical protein [Photobacterium sp. TY1-4]|uniref:hypothetical protein n=1 Tax=Photobacterium sp. TY1-4 TaxID=2899122 RepID=UPI0021C12780|nr:hypothetical protein [Photobacterium sp. TY1-4]UXI03121.1 hypothetical protein NH461_22030 [Photobacterium sp. TY1-4]
MMNNLSTYVSALQGKETKVAIVEHQSTQHQCEEDGVIINAVEHIVTFSNGVTLATRQEWDHPDTFSEGVSEDVCTECWITYEITANLQHLPIRPRKKSFANRCQAAFWLKINDVRAAN